MTPRRSRRRRALSQINVVPYIDVMLVLLVIFMVTAPMLKQGVEIDLPQAPAEALPPDEPNQPEPVVVEVDEQGRLYISPSEGDQGPLTPEALSRRAADLLGAQPDRPVYVRGDWRVRYGRVVDAMVVLQRAGADKVGLITEPSGEDES